MFVIARLLDSVAVRAAEPDKKCAVLDALKSKYLGCVVGDEGLALSLYSVSQSDKYIADGEKLIAHVDFQLLLFRAYADEICVGTITKQDEDSISISNKYFSNFVANSFDLFADSEFVRSERAGNWIWNYKNSRFQFQTGEMVHFRIKNAKINNRMIEVSMNEQGLGPITWWN